MPTECSVIIKPKRRPGIPMRLYSIYVTSVPVMPFLVFKPKEKLHYKVTYKMRYLM